MSERIPVIFDTDIGSDIDDAVALAYLLGHPDCELVGITTASGAQRDRARLASAVCRAADRDEVPIHCGPEPSILRGDMQRSAPQAAALEKWSHRDDFEPCTAVEWLRQTIRERPGELTLVSVGPMTNIGLLFATDPEIPSLLADYVLMGGRFLPAERPGVYSEWNLRCDPEGGAIGFDRGPQGMRAVGLDVTLQCRLPAEQIRERFTKAGGPLAPVLDFAEVWFSLGRPRITFHDPLATACVFQPDLCDWRTGRVKVELKSDLVAGLTHFQPEEDGPHQIAAKVDVERFFAHYFEITGG